MSEAPARTVRRLAPSELTAEAGALLATGRRLALVAGPDELRAVYVFLAPAPASTVELHVALAPGEPVPDLGPLVPAADRFARQRPVGPGPRSLLGRGLADALDLVDRSAGDTPVGHALAFCRAVEDALGLHVPADARRMRAVLLEFERLHRHVSDVATLCRLAGLPAPHGEARRIVERLRRAHLAMTGDPVLHGGVLLAGAAVRRLVDADAIVALGVDVRRLVDDVLHRPAVTPRLTGTATLTTAQARDVGALGVVARASGVDIDARRDHPTDVLADFGLQLGDILTVPVQADGDVVARLRQRGAEVEASVAALDTLLRTINPGLVTNWPTADFSPPGPSGASGIGISEGWRGTVVHRVELDADLRIVDARAADPSFFNTSARDLALVGTPAADLPLARSSFS